MSEFSEALLRGGLKATQKSNLLLAKQLDLAMAGLSKLAMLGGGQSDGNKVAQETLEKIARVVREPSDP